MERNKIKQLSSVLMFDLNDKQIDLLCEEFVNLDKILSILNKINVDQLQPTDFPITKSTNCLREDITSSYDKKEYMKNASNKNENYFIVK